MSTPLPKTYNASDYEDKIYQKWEKSGFFNPDICVKKGVTDKDAPVFSLMMPPPNVTGVLHLGHALENALMDTMVRYQRMQGKRTLFLPGTDHAAVATQSRVEQDLIDSGKFKNPREELGRSKLLKIIRKYAEDSKATIIKQIKKMGSSCDWSRLAYTFDKERSRAVNAMFRKMYEDGLIYRGYRVVNWSVRGQSTCSDDELVHVPRKTTLYTFKYSKNFPISIATTRPETKLGDTAVAVNPSDRRYKKYVGKVFKVDVGAMRPLELKIIADEAVDMKFGTGAVGVTPAHSQVDYEIYEQQKAKGDEIDLIAVIGKDGKMTKDAGTDYEGLTVTKAREKFVEYLRKNNLLEKEEEIEQNVGTSDRFKDAVEVLPMEQWFVDVNRKIPGKDKSLKDLMREAVTTGHNGNPKQKIKITPERFHKSYLQWIDNLRDWCISRQIWWGHRVPVWYCGNPENIPKYKMGFHKDVVPQVFKGKTKTYRLRDHNFQAGNKVFFENSQTKTFFGYGIIKSVEKMRVDEIDYKDKTHYKTYKNLKELMAAFKLRNPEKNVSPKSAAYLYEYEFHSFTKEDAKRGCRQVIVSIHKPKHCPACQGTNLSQDPDTLDTWFSSGLWTFSTSGWPERTNDLKTYHPTTWMQMGYEILFFWMARMILMSTYGLDEIPFKDAYIHGMLRNEQGKKFSKSDKTGTDPLELIKQYGTDALRLSLILGISPGNDARFYDDKIRGSRNFINKLWNVSRFILINTKDAKNAKLAKMRKTTLTLADRWILSELNKVIQEVTKDFEEFQFSRAGEVLQEFTWTKLADWYLEISKVEGGKDGILIHILTNLLKLWQPFTPFVTEQIWSAISDDLLMVEKWPTADEGLIDAEAEKEFTNLQELVTTIRNLKAEKKIEPREIMKVKIKAKKYHGLIKEQKNVIEKLGRCEISEKGEKLII